jgi:hypothetical protein
MAAANRDIDAIIRDYPTNTSLHYLRAMVLEAKGQKIEAEAQSRVTRELDAEEFATLEKLYGRFRKR